MTTTESGSMLVKDEVKRMHAQIEQRERELDEINDSIREAKDEQEALKASDSAMMDRIEQLAKQLDRMSQPPAHTAPNVQSPSNPRPAEAPQWDPPAPKTPAKPPRPTVSPGATTQTPKPHPQVKVTDPPRAVPDTKPPKQAGDRAPSRPQSTDTNHGERPVKDTPIKKRAPAEEHGKDRNTGSPKGQEQRKQGARNEENAAGEMKENKIDEGRPTETEDRKSSPDKQQTNSRGDTSPQKPVNESPGNPSGQRHKSRLVPSIEGGTDPQVHSSESVTAKSVQSGEKEGKDVRQSGHVTNDREKAAESQHDCPDVRPEHLDQDATKPVDHYFDVVNSQHKGKPGQPAANKQQNGFHWEVNSKLVSVMSTNDDPQPLIYLFKFHASVSQSTIDGRKSPSRACAIISMLFAQKFNENPSDFPVEAPIKTVPDRVFGQVEEAIREGNNSHEMTSEGQPVDLGPEEVITLTRHLGLEIVYETDVDTRELDKLVPEVMRIGPGQAIMFIKNYRVVSLVPCNNDTRLLLFDSHPHFVITDHVRKMYGAYLFYFLKEEQVVKDLFMYYDNFCDPKPFYGKLVIFKCSKI